MHAYRIKLICSFFFATNDDPIPLITKPLLAGIHHCNQLERSLLSYWLNCSNSTNYIFPYCFELKKIFFNYGFMALMVALTIMLNVSFLVFLRELLMFWPLSQYDVSASSLYW